MGLTRRYLVHAIAVLGIAGLIAAVFTRGMPLIIPQHLD